LPETRSVPAARHETVSFDDEPLILVDAADREIGHLDKASAHDGAGVLHRAFSLFVFNPAGEVLMQQRAADKRLWPLYWSNSCCSHPRRGESLELAIHRRLVEELGFDCALRHLFTFTYQASFGAAGSEHELCHVYAGSTAAVPGVNASEIAAIRWLAPAALDAEIAAAPERFTPWFKLEWQCLRTEHAELFGR